MWIYSFVFFSYYFPDDPYLKRMHSMTDVHVLDLLVEDDGDAVVLLAILLGQDEGMALGIVVLHLLLRAKPQPLGQHQSA